MTKTGRTGTARPTPTAKRPFDPARLPLYYGWAIAVVATLGMVASIPGQTAGVSVFTDSLIDSTGLSRLQLASAYLVGTASSGLLLPTAGGWIDRFGARTASVVATIALAAAVTALSFVGPMSPVVGLGVMSLGFACLRFSGQGVLTLASRTMLARWFDRRRGLVTSAAGAAMSYAFSVSPAALLWLVDTHGWRSAWRLIGVGLVTIVGTLVVVFYRDSPEACGMTVDTGTTRPESELPPGTDTPGAASDADRATALRDVRFWIVTSPVAIFSLTVTALTFHILDLGSELGMDREEIIWIFVPISLVAIPVGLLSGWAVDRVPVVGLAVAMSLAQIVMCLTVGEMAEPAARWLAIISWGTAQGLFGPLTAAALPRLFGRAHLGAISGVQTSAMVIGSAVGPAFFAVAKSVTGQYRPGLWLCLVVPVGVIAATSWSVARSR